MTQDEHTVAAAKDLPADMPPLPPAAVKFTPGAPAPKPAIPLRDAEDPTWWRLGSIPFLVLVMVAAAADLAWPRESGWGIGAGIGCVLALSALLMLRKDFSKGEICFCVGLAVVNFIALALSGSTLNWIVCLVLPFIMVMVPRCQDPVPAGKRYHNWWTYWTSVRRKSGAESTGTLVESLRNALPLLVCILVGVILFIAFLCIFAQGNPVVEAVWNAIVETWNRVVAFLHIGWDFLLHVLFWVIGILWFGIYTFRRPDANAPILNKMTIPATGGHTILPQLPICSLVGINLAFLVATSTDIAYLWCNRVPEGISQTTYLHEGAVSITWASILAVAILVFLFRSAGSARRSMACRVAGYLLVLQTLLLAVSVYMRLYYQIGDYGFTPRRVHAAEVMLLGVSGLVVLVCYMACSGSFWKYAKICLASMALMLIAFSIYSPARLAGDLNLHYVATHPHWKFASTDFGPTFGRFGVEDNLAFACYVNKVAPSLYLESRIKNEAEKIEKRAAHSSWLSWNLAFANDAAAASEVLQHPVELHVTAPDEK